MAYRLLFFAKDDCGTEKGHYSSGSGNADKVVCAGGRILGSVLADGEGGGGGIAREVNRQGVGTDGQRLHVGCRQLHIGAAGPGLVVGFIEGYAVNGNGLQLAEFLIDAEGGSGAGGYRLVGTGLLTGG